MAPARDRVSLHHSYGGGPGLRKADVRPVIQQSAAGGEVYAAVVEATDEARQVGHLVT
jgi:hypothetical protein